MVCVPKLQADLGLRVAGWRDRAARGLSTAALLVLTLPAMALAQSQEPVPPQTSGNPNFIPAPTLPTGKDSALDSILGVDVNVIFFVAVAVIGVLWFTIGGGRKAKVKRS